MGFGKVKAASVFGTDKSKLQRFSSQKTAVLLKSLKNKFYIFRPIVGRLLKYPILLGGAMSTKYFDSQLNPMIAQITQVNGAIKNSYHKKIKLLDYIFIAFPIAFLIGAVIVMLYFKNSIIRVLNLIDEKIKQIAAGDLTSKIKISGVHKESEIGILIEQVNSLVDSLSGNVRGIISTSNSLSSLFSGSGGFDGGV